MYWSYLDSQVHSKAASLDWAIEHFARPWAPLLTHVRADRSLGWDPDQRPREGSPAQTYRFAMEVLSRVG